MNPYRRTTFVASVILNTNFQQSHSVSHTSFIPSWKSAPKLRQSKIRTLVYASAISNGHSLPLETSSSPSLTKESNGTVQKQQHSERYLIRFLKLMFKEWRLMVPALIAGVIASICTVSQPYLYGRINGLLAKAYTMPIQFARQQLFVRCARIATIYFFEVTCTIIFVSLMAKVIDKASRKLRETLFNEALSNDIGFFDATGRTAVEKSVTDDIKDIREGLVGNLSRDRGFRACIEVIMGIILSMCITGLLGAPIFGLLVPIVGTVAARTGIRSGRIAAVVGNKEGHVRSFISERIRGLRTVKAFGGEGKERRALTGLLNITEEATNKRSGSKALSEGTTRLSVYLTVLCFFTTGGLFISSGRLTFEMFTCLTGFVWLLNFSIQGISFTISDIAKVAKSLENVYSVLDQVQNYKRSKLLSTNSSTFPLSGIRGALSFQDVRFHYPSRPDNLVLKGINFSMNPGDVVALVGESGGGKSTIAAILSRFYAPSGGKVLLDGYDIQQLAPKEFSRHIAVVDQEPVLFQGTIRENISYGLPDEELDDETIVQAAKEANAHEFIISLKDGYDTVWTPASNLSGGQKQRIAIARSLVKSPELLILDEATSALDQQSERVVQTAIEKLMKKRTVLIIAHRLSTVRSADMIHVVENGAIVESGSYNALLEKPDGHFRELVNSSLELV